MANSNGDKLIRDISDGVLDLSQHDVTDIFDEYGIIEEHDIEKVLGFFKKNKIEVHDTNNISGAPAFDKNPGDETEQEHISKSIYAVYLEDIKRFPQLTKEEELRIAEDAAKGNKEAEHMLICSNLLTPVFLARKYARSYAEINDLIQAGNLGLMKAIKKFDYRKGFRLSTYASWSALQEIQTFRNANSGAVTLPSSIVYNRNKIKAATSKLQDELGRQPTLIEVARKLDMSVYDVNRILKITLDPVSLNNTQSSGDSSDKEMSYIDNLVDENLENNPLMKLCDRELQENIEYALSKLNYKDALILRMLYGIGYPHRYACEDVAKVLEISSTRVRQLEKKALRKLRLMNQKRTIKDYMNYL